MEVNDMFLGKGWSFPPEFNRQAKAVKMLEGEDDIDSSLEILLSTRLGERVMLPEYGCRIDELLFKPLNLTLKTYIIDLIKVAILYHEPRIDVKKVAIEANTELDGQVLIDINYVVRTTNSRKNKVFPFYKVEGSEL